MNVLDVHYQTDCQPDSSSAQMELNITGKRVDMSPLLPYHYSARRADLWKA